MPRRLITAVLVLALGLTAAGCTSSNAGTSARNWRDNDTAARGWQKESQDQTMTVRNESRGPLEEGQYAADKDGRLRNNHRSTANSAAAAKAREAGRDMANGAKDAGRDMANGAKNAARSIGDAAEDALDNMKDAAKDVGNQTRNGISPNGQGTGLNP